jgi:hypothetical protein
LALFGKSSQNEKIKYLEPEIPTANNKLPEIVIAPFPIIEKALLT